MSPFYKRLFPGAKLVGGKQSVQEFTTQENGRRLSTSIGGVLTGRGADIIIIDDPLKPDDAVSDTCRNSMTAHFTVASTTNKKARSSSSCNACTRTTSSATCSIRRVGKLSVCRRSPKRKRSSNSKLRSAPSGLCAKPAISSTLPGSRGRRSNKSAAPSANTILRASTSSRQPLGGGFVKRNWFKIFDPQSPPRFDRIIQSWDTAIKVNQVSDHSVGATWGIKDKNTCLLNVLRRRLEYPEPKRMVIDQMRLHRASVVLIEDKASGQQPIQELRWANVRQIKPYSPEGDKVMRLHAQTAMIEGGFVFIPTQAPWLDL